MKKFSDQIKDLENTLASKAARLEEIMTKATDEGRTLDDAEAEEFDGIEVEIKTINADLSRLKRLESLSASATPVTKEAGHSAAGAAAARVPGGMAITKAADKDEAFQGQNFTRMVIARTMSQLDRMNMAGDFLSPAEIAAQRWGKSNPKLVEVIRTGVAGHGSGSGEPGAELVALNATYTGDFINYLYAQTIYDRLPLRMIPANVTVKGQDGTATGYWVGENKPIPASKGDFSSVTLSPLKVAALAACSLELMRDSSPSAEMLIRDALVNAAAQRIDTTFLSATAASAGVSPAGMLNGVTAIGSIGDDGDSVRADIANLYAPFIAANNASGLAFVMNTALAKKLQLMRNALGQREFDGITQTGGTLEGDAAYTGDNVNSAHLILLKPSDIYKIDARGVEVALSNDATIEMDTAPTGEGDTPTAQSASMVSMFQAGMVALRVIAPINFAKRRSHAVQYINDAAYGTVASA